MEICRTLKECDLKRAIEIINEYLPGNSEEEVLMNYRDFPSAVIGYYMDDKLVGICFGKPTEGKTFQLCGIAVVFPNNKSGRGGVLIREFEKNVAKLGYEKISLGSASGYAEGFYMKNGYTPTELKVLSREVPKDCGMDWIETEGNDYKLVKVIGDYFSLNREEIVSRCRGYHSFIVFEKSLIEKG